MMTKTAEEAEREVEASRGELNRTMEALRDRMTPGQLFDEAMRTMGGTGEQILSKFASQAKENPMPLAVMGVGLAWLMMSNNRQSAGGYAETRSFAPARDYGGGSDGLGDRASDAMRDAADRASDLANAARDGMSNAADSARSTMHDGMGAMSDAAGQAAQTARQAAGKVSALAGDAASRAGEMGHRAQDMASDLLAKEPLLLGAIGLLLGLAVGAAVPSTEAEDRLLGRTRDKVLEKGKALAQDKMDDLKDVAQAAYGDAVEQVRKGAGDSQDLATTAQKAVQAGLQTLREQGEDVVRH